jgi:GT2 family glycosyltransferase
MAARPLTRQDGRAVATDLPLVSISVVSHAHRAELEDLLDSLARHEPARRLQLIITDNLGRDLPELDDSRWHSLTMLRNDRQRGYAENHNLAFRHARGEYFCVLNPDVDFQGATFEPLIRRLAERHAGIAAPLIADSRGEIQDSFMLFRTEIFSALGGFDARYRLYFEDVELCTRARLVGLSIVVDTHVRLRHDARRASARPGRHQLWHALSAARFFASDVYRSARRARAGEPPGAAR